MMPRHWKIKNYVLSDLSEISTKMINTLKNKPKRILITGASGFLGWNLASVLRHQHKVFYTYSDHRIDIPHCRGIKMDLRRPFTIENCLRYARPDVVIHAAALANTGLCEKHPQLAYDVNVRGTDRLLRRLCNPKTLFVYISTDLVFDGQNQPYNEQSPTNPVNYYGKTKLMAEQIVRRSWSNHVILRTALMYGACNPIGKGSFLQWMDNAFQNGDQLTLFSDEYRTPAYAGDVAKTIQALINKKITARTYHIGGPERITRVAFGQKLARLRNYDQSLINPVKMSTIKTSCPRAQDVSLDSSLLQRSLLVHLTPVEQALMEIFSE